MAFPERLSTRGFFCHLPLFAHGGADFVVAGAAFVDAGAENAGALPVIDLNPFTSF